MRLLLTVCLALFSFETSAATVAPSSGPQPDLALSIKGQPLVAETKVSVTFRAGAEVAPVKVLQLIPARLDRLAGVAQAPFIAPHPAPILLTFEKTKAPEFVASYGQTKPTVVREVPIGPTIFSMVSALSLLLLSGNRTKKRMEFKYRRDEFSAKPILP